MFYYQGFYGMGLMMIVFWVFCIIGLIYMMRCFSGNGSCHSHSSHSPSDDQSLAILKERYAKGEINQQEFERMKKYLQK